MTMTTMAAPADESLECRCFPNLAYGSDDLQVIDLYVPATGAGPAPLAMFIHGGGWRSGSRGPLALHAAWVRDGFTVARIGYRSSTTARFPAQLDDCREALDLLRRNHRRFDIDPLRCFVAGHSAGGHLASLLACTTPGITAAVNQAGPTDFLAWFNDGSREPGPRAANHDALSTLLGSIPDGASPAWRQLSPSSHVGDSTPPHLLMYAEHDELIGLEQAHAFQRRMKEHGRICELMCIPQGSHSDARFFDLPSMDLQARFFRRFL